MQEPLIRQACDWLEGQQQAMVDCLEALVNIDSNSYDKAGTDAVADLITQWLEQDGITVIRHQRPNSGDILEAQLGEAGQGHALLMGHRDTFFRPAPWQAEAIRKKRTLALALAWPI